MLRKQKDEQTKQALESLAGIEEAVTKRETRKDKPAGRGTSQHVLQVNTVSGVLEFNIKTGETKLGPVKANFNEGTKPYKLLRLVIEKSLENDKADLYSIGETVFNKKRENIIDTKTITRDTSFILKEIKIALGILRSTKQRKEKQGPTTKDIFRSGKGYWIKQK